VSLGLAAVIFVVFTVAQLLLLADRRAQKRFAPKVLDGNQAHIAALECELGLCDHAVYVPGETWMVCPRQINRPTLDQIDEAYDQWKYTQRRALPSARREHGVTNDFGPLNHELWEKKIAEGREEAYKASLAHLLENQEGK
jgi:hypothetical protein